MSSSNIDLRIDLRIWEMVSCITGSQVGSVKSLFSVCRICTFAVLLPRFIIVFYVKCLICHARVALAPILISCPFLSCLDTSSLHRLPHHSLLIFPSVPHHSPPCALLLTPISDSLSQKKQLCPNYSVIMSVFILYSLLFKDINNKNKHNTQ